MTGTERGHELNFTDDPVIGQSRVICIASIRWDCCWQGMGICRWSVCQILVAFSLSLFSQAEIYWPPLRSCKNVCVLKNGKRCEVSIRHNWHSRTFLFYIQDVFHESKSHKKNMSYWYYAEKKTRIRHSCNLSKSIVFFYRFKKKEMWKVKANLGYTMSTRSDARLRTNVILNLPFKYL